MIRMLRGATRILDLPWSRDRTSRRSVLGSVSLALFSTAARSNEVLVIGKGNEDDVLTNVCVLVVSEAFRRTGLTLSLQASNLTRSIELANDGTADGDLYRIADVIHHFPNLVAVPTPISHVDVEIFAATPRILSMTRANILKLNVAIERGLFVTAKYSAGMSVTEGSTDLSLLDMVANGRVDIAMVTQDSEQLLRGAFARELTKWPYRWATEPVFLILHRRHVGIVPRIDAALMEMKREGLIEKIYRTEFAKYGIEPLFPEPAAASSKATRPGIDRRDRAK